MKKYPFLILAMFGVLLLVAAYFFQRSTQGPTVETPGNGYNNTQENKSGAPVENTGGATNEAPSPSLSGSTSQEQTIRIQGNEFSFSPKTITVKRGEHVRFEFTNTGKFPHNFAIESTAGLFGTTKTIGTGQTDSLALTMPNGATKVQFSTLCTVPGHAERGMTGTLIVE